MIPQTQTLSHQALSKMSNRNTAGSSKKNLIQSMTKTIRSFTLTAFCFMLFTLNGCSSQNENDDGTQIDYSDIPVLTLEKEFSIASTEDYIPARIRDILVSDDGTILVSEQSEKAIHQFDSSGNYLARVARSGRGPGELTQYANAHFNGNILVMSNNDGKLTEYRPNNEGMYRFVKDHAVRLPGPVRGIRSENELSSVYVTVDSVRTPFGVVPPEFTTDFVHIVNFTDDSLQVEENVLSLKKHSSYIRVIDDGNRMVHSSLPYRYSDDFRSLPNKKILVQRPGESVIQIFDKNVDLEHEVEVNIKGRPFTEEDMVYHFPELNSSERAERRELILDLKPPFMWVTLDDEQRFWLFTDLTTNGTEYVILSYDGDPLGRVFLPDNNILHTVMNDRLYVFNRMEATIDVYSVDLNS